MRVNVSPAMEVAIQNAGNYRHGHAAKVGGRQSRAYESWCGMIARCENASNPKHKNYGARGIAVCERWRNSFEAFLLDMGQPPPKMTLGRIDNDGHYEPGNCRWETSYQQASNKRNNRSLTAFGQTKLMSAWAREFDIRLQNLQSRLRCGWAVETALLTPIEVRGSYIKKGAPQ